MKKKKKKGEFGYIDFMRMYTIVSAALLYLGSFLIFASGWIYSGKRENILTVVAVLGILPASKRAVNAIMFQRFHSAPDEIYENCVKLSKSCGIRIDSFFFDSVLTIERGGSGQIDAFFCKNGELVGLVNESILSKKKKDGLAVFDGHLKLMLKNNELSDVKVRLYGKDEHFYRAVERICEEGKIADDKETVNEADKRVLALLAAISL